MTHHTLMYALKELWLFNQNPYTADFGHSGPRLAIASCGHSGNYTLRHWIRSHDRAQYGSCTLGLVWQLPVWIRMARHIDICHSGHSWQLSLGPRVAATWLFMVIYYFFIFNTKMRRLDGSRVVPSIIPAPLLLRWYGDVQLVSFFFFVTLSKLFILEQLFSRWFHVGPVVFGSFMLTCYLEPSWFPFFKILSPGVETNHFCNKTGFFRWFHVVPHVFWLLCVKVL